MIAKIEKLKNIGNFDDYSATGDVSLKKMNLIYAENGAGKTTIARVLQSLSTGDARIIGRHKRIGAAGNPEVKIKDERNGFHIFNGVQWNHLMPDISVFDSHFVSNNVYSGFEINSDHHKSLYEFVVGEMGVAYTVKIDRAKNLISILNDEITNQAERICAASNSKDVESICRLEQMPEIDKIICEKRIELNLSKNQAEIRAHEMPAIIRMPVLSFNYENTKAILETSIEGVGVEFLKRVETHLRLIEEAGIPNSREWIFRGVAAASDQCPFCGQDLKNAKDIIEGYNQYFSEEYRRVAKDAHDLNRAFSAINIKSFLLQISMQYQKFVELMNYWKTVIVPEKQLPLLSIEDFPIEESFCSLFEVIKLKNDNPLVAVAVDSLDSFYLALSALARKLEEINTFVTEYSAEIVSIRDKIRPVEDVETELKELVLIKARFEEPLLGLCQRYGSLKRRLDKVKRINLNLQQQQKVASNQLFQQYGQKMNDYLRNVFMTPFHLADVKDGGFRGTSKRPNLDYTLIFNGVEIRQDEGLSNTSFKNVLSEGDKNTIAFSFFLSKLASDPNIANKIVVFDDPLTSLDQNRRMATIDQLVALYNNCKQVIVLSHNLQFLIELSLHKDIKKSNKKELIIIKGGDSSSIREYELKRDWMDKYKRSIIIMESFLRDPHPEDQENAINSIRLTLELMLKLKFCMHIPDPNLTFGQLIDALKRDSNCVFMNPNKEEVISKLEILNAISWRTHHAAVEEREVYQEVNASLSEARGYVQETLRMLKSEL